MWPGQHSDCDPPSASANYRSKATSRRGDSCCRRCGDRGPPASRRGGSPRSRRRVEALRRQNPRYACGVPEPCSEKPFFRRSARTIARRAARERPNKATSTSLQSTRRCRERDPWPRDKRCRPRGRAQERPGRDWVRYSKPGTIPRVAGRESGCLRRRVARSENRDGRRDSPRLQIAIVRTRRREAPIGARQYSDAPPSRARRTR